MDSPASLESTPSVTSYSGSLLPPNPYQRMASRRAIACVTCAKAKTKCDKGLPSCSRCVTKGLHCEPRSTRRTSENSYRSNVKKPFVSPRRYQPTGNVSSFHCHQASRSLPPTESHRYRRADSHLDFRAAGKMGYEATAISGHPMLTPLPTYSSQIIEECYPYSGSPEQNMNGIMPSMDSNRYPSSGPLTPQTPEAHLYHEPIAIGDLSEQWMTSQPYPDNATESIGLGFDAEVTTMLPTGLWSGHDTAQSAPLPQMSWPHPSLSASPQRMSAELVPHIRAVPSLSISECSVEDLSTTSAFSQDMGQWSSCLPSTTSMDGANTTTTAPYMHGLRIVSSTAPVWEDVFMPGPTPY